MTAVATGAVLYGMFPTVTIWLGADQQHQAQTGRVEWIIEQLAAALISYYKTTLQGLDLVMPEQMYSPSWTGQACTPLGLQVAHQV